MGNEEVIWSALSSQANYLIDQSELHLPVSKPLLSAFLGHNVYLCTSLKVLLWFSGVGVDCGIISIDCNSGIYILFWFFIPFPFEELISITKAVAREDWLYWIHIELIKKHRSY